MTAQESLELSILMPCLNEAETLSPCIQKAAAFLSRSGIHGEIIVADNGSADGSRDLATRLGARLIDVPLRGYGAALSHGATAAHGKYIIMGDSDDSYDFSNLDGFLNNLRAGDDLVMGNRFAGKIHPGAMPWKNRYIGNPILSSIGRIFYKCPVADFHCGLRGFSADAFRRMDLRTTGMEFASEMVIKANLLNMKISEVPTDLHPAGRSRPPHLRPWRDGWRHLRFMLLYSPRWLFLYPGLLLMIFGALLGLWLLPAPRHIGRATLDVHTLLYAALAVLVGFQSVTFAVFTKVFAITTGLLPKDDRFDRTFKIVTLEVGLVAGALMLLMGTGYTIYCFLQWKSINFGPLQPAQVLRILIPAFLLLALGSQTILASFFLSVLGLNRK